MVAASILLANVYAASGELEKSSDIRRQLQRSGKKKKPGLAWTAVNGQLYVSITHSLETTEMVLLNFFQRFRAHDRSHPRSAEIYAELDRLSDELLKHGHHFDSSWITRPIDVDETVASVLCGHSEKLAIAWNFVANPSTKRIQVTKNLRVCGDCREFTSHPLLWSTVLTALYLPDAATKLIARIRQCEIIVRDANRIHHFNTEGQCSCGDYF